MADLDRISSVSNIPMAYESTSLYLPDRSELPVDTPRGFPHLINLKHCLEDAVAMSDVKLHIADALATFCYNFHPEILDVLLDLSIKNFEFRHTRKSAAKFDFFIERKENIVTVSVQ